MKPNIDQQGKRVRAIAGVISLVAGAGMLLVVRPGSTSVIVTGCLLTVTGLFMLFEAARGWCLLRACGIRTRV